MAFRRSVCVGALVAAATGMAPALAADVVAVRVGDGASALSSAAAAVFLERRAPDGSNLGVVALPTTVSGANQPITLGGTSSSEGALAVSVDGRYVTLAGYAAAPGTAAISSSTSATATRVVARVDALSNVDTSTLLGAAFGASSVRGAVSTDGSVFWVSGNASSAPLGGVRYATLGTSGSGTQVLASPSNVRTVNIAAGQLFGDSGSGSFTNVFSIGFGLPTMAGQVATSLPGLPTATESPYGFVFFDRSAAIAGIDTLYIADDRNIASGGGIQKWTFDGNMWNLQATFTNGLVTGVRGLAAEAVGATRTAA